MPIALALVLVPCALIALVVLAVVIRPSAGKAVAEV
jgi:hypothetical protein